VQDAGTVVWISRNWGKASQTSSSLILSLRHSHWKKINWRKKRFPVFFSITTLKWSIARPFFRHNDVYRTVHDDRVVLFFQQHSQHQRRCTVSFRVSEREPEFLGAVGFLTTWGVGIGFFCPTPTVQLDHFLHHTPKLGIPVQMVQFLLKLLLNQRFLAVHHDFQWF